MVMVKVICSSSCSKEPGVFPSDFLLTLLKRQFHWRKEKLDKEFWLKLLTVPLNESTTWKQNCGHSEIVKLVHLNERGSTPLRHTLQQGGDEGRGHTAGTQQHSVTHLELSFRDPAKNNGCHCCQKPHHCCLDLKIQGWSSRQSHTPRCI